MIWSCNCLGIINPSHRPAHHRRAAANVRHAASRCSQWVIVPYPTDLTNATVAAISHHDDGDSEHYRSSILLLAYPHPTV
jgi:hypothetical protein